MPDAVKCNCRHPECTTCNPPDPDPTAAELARCVAWLRARAKRFKDHVEYHRRKGWILSTEKYVALEDAAADLERGEQP